MESGGCFKFCVSSSIEILDSTLHIKKNNKKTLHMKKNEIKCTSLTTKKNIKWQNETYVYNKNETEKNQTVQDGVREISRES